ncbi:sulfatase-like hydrolase/transferase [Edaphobacter flagellatus]|uniref:sulfatase-like hydrolase/transferase n=1 Tax=Edaphobacter flagellatus TaxID=1933044 RepID=UPI0021B2BB62|nr:sulfatase-like hydrolase/transferase [Edaphobacter flagellatus]
MKRRDLLKSLGALTATSAITTHPAEAATPQHLAERPNILVFLTDDHGQWLQQAYGNSEVHTPNMSRIARNGVRMDNAFTTSPVCSPARASFFTGRMPSQHGIHDWIEESKQAYAFPWLEDQTLISQLLHDAGYHTGLVGKWHCGHERTPHPGFDFWFSYWVNQYPHTGKQQFSDNGTLVTPDGLQSPLLTDQALRFLHTHYETKSTAQKPFFLFVGYTDTHSPHTQMPDEIVALYRDATFRDIPREPFANVHGKPLLPVTADAAAERAKHQQYYAAATTIDREIGRVLDHLQSIHQLDNTLIVYTGDHGLNAGHHGMWEKGNATTPQNFLDESIRIPCAISWPRGGITQNLTSDLPVNHCDLFATLLEAAQATPSPQQAQKINSPGRSYLAHLRGQPSTAPMREDDTVICEYGNARMIRSRGYKLILRYPYQGVTFPNELYDLKADPRETISLYSQSQYAAITESLAAQLSQYFATYTTPQHDGLHLDQQPLATPASPWLAALKT